MYGGACFLMRESGAVSKGAGHASRDLKVKSVDGMGDWSRKTGHCLMFTLCGLHCVIEI